MADAPTAPTAATTPKAGGGGWGDVALFGADLFFAWRKKKAQDKAYSRASQAQFDYAGKAIGELESRYDELEKLLSPYRTTGASAISAQQDLLGLSGPEAQQAAIASLASSPQFSALMQQGENALLQNASATGGLRGGNLQAALGQFRPQILSQLIESQFKNLGGLSALGAQTAGAQSGLAFKAGEEIGKYFTNQGQAIAGGELGKGQSATTFWDSVGRGFGQLGKGLGGLGGKLKF